MIRHWLPQLEVSWNRGTPKSSSLVGLSPLIVMLVYRRVPQWDSEISWWNRAGHEWTFQRLGEVHLHRSCCHLRARIRAMIPQTANFFSLVSYDELQIGLDPVNMYPDCTDHSMPWVLKIGPWCQGSSFFCFRFRGNWFCLILPGRVVHSQERQLDGLKGLSTSIQDCSINVPLKPPILASSQWDRLIAPVTKPAGDRDRKERGPELELVDEAWLGKAIWGFP